MFNKIHYLVLIVLFAAVWAGFAQDAGTPDESGIDAVSENTVDSEVLLEEIEVLKETVDALRKDLDKVERKVDGSQPKLQPSFNTSVTLEAGVDLDTLAFGFSNKISHQLTLTLLDEATKESVARGPLVGYIKITDFSVDLLDANSISGSNGSVEAKLLWGAWDLLVSSAPALLLNNAWKIYPDQTAAITAIGNVAYSPDYPAMGGLTVHYNRPRFSLGLGLASEGNYEANSLNTFHVKADFEYDYEPFYIYAAVADQFKIGTLDEESGFTTNGDFGATALFEGTIPLVNGLILGTAADFYLEKALDAFADFGSPEFDFRPYAEFRYSSKAVRDFEDVYSNVRLEGYLNPESKRLDLRVSAYEIDEDDGLFKGLGYEIGAGFYDILESMDDEGGFRYSLDGEVSYLIKKIKPYVAASYFNKKVIQETVSGEQVLSTKDGVVALTAGVSLTMVPRTEFVFEYANDDLSSGNGVFTSKCIITF
ncbi:MAG: hypothetical protein JXR86_18025 [Spirochaetales bacterium]|nr:hypothetical protein [Spirochaetales bacterium]